MSSKSTAIQLQYKGYLNTPLLWKFDVVVGLEQLEIPKQIAKNFSGSLPSNLRLGKLIERFVSNELSQNKSITILAENLQIIDHKLTLGEIDCLFKSLDELIHLEIIYKFYLYDQKVGTTELEHWIGPNRKDSLTEKLTKLTTKQLPILFHKEAVSLLKKLNLNPEDFKQKVYFKAQLFVPFHLLNVTFPIINNKCISGFYMGLRELEILKTHSFYIPSKVDWITDVQLDVEWLNYEQFIAAVTEQLQNKRAPMCWLQDTNGNTQKFFIVWWEQK